MPKNFRVTRTRNRAYPYAWRCTIPDPDTHTGECGVGAFAETEYLIQRQHDAHMAADHEPRGEQ